MKGCGNDGAESVSCVSCEGHRAKPLTGPVGPLDHLAPNLKGPGSVCHGRTFIFSHGHGSPSRALTGSTKKRSCVLSVCVECLF